MKTITLKDLFNRKELRLIAKLKYAKAICEQVVQPNIERINKVVGQENDPMYIAYMCEHAMTQGAN